VPGETVGSALDALFEKEQRLRGYVLDDQGEVRRHVAIFVGGERRTLAHRVGADEHIYVLQALSGG
jgi:hypothetical protein